LDLRQKKSQTEKQKVRVFIADDYQASEIVIKVIQGWSIVSSRFSIN